MVLLCFLIANGRNINKHKTCCFREWILLCRIVAVIPKPQLYMAKSSILFQVLREILCYAANPKGGN